MDNNIVRAPPSHKLTVCKDMRCLCGNEAILAPRTTTPPSPPPKEYNFAPAKVII